MNSHESINHEIKEIKSQYANKDAVANALLEKAKQDNDKAFLSALRYGGSLGILSAASFTITASLIHHIGAPTEDAGGLIKYVLYSIPVMRTPINLMASVAIMAGGVSAYREAFVYKYYRTRTRAFLGEAKSLINS